MKTCELFKFHTGYCDVHYCWKSLCGALETL